jgi:predicted nucleic acid-binding protein
VILVDTGPLVALCNPRDSLHRRAATEFSSLTRQGFSICEPVLAETCFHLRHPIQRRRLQAIIEQFDIHPAAVADVHAFWLDVFQWLAKYADHEPDWADGCIAVLSGYHDRLKVWTYDREFKTTWRRQDGSSIPLAIKL